MTEESKYYIGPSKTTQATYDLIGSRIQGYIAAYDLIRSRIRRYKPPTTLLDPESEGTQVACDLIGSRIYHTR
jgi:hypothetical protein